MTTRQASLPTGRSEILEIDRDDGLRPRTLDMGRAILAAHRRRSSASAASKTSIFCYIHLHVVPLAYTTSQEVDMLRQLKTGRKLATALCSAHLWSLVAAALHSMRGGRARRRPRRRRCIAAALPDRRRRAAGAARARLGARARGRRRLRRRCCATAAASSSRSIRALQRRAERAARRASDALRRRGGALGRRRPRAGDGRPLDAPSRDKSAADLALKPWAPAASVFKLVTAAALVERGVARRRRASATTTACTRWRRRTCSAHPRWDSRLRARSPSALAKSQNAIIARLAHDHLDADAARAHRARARLRRAAAVRAAGRPSRGARCPTAAAARSRASPPASGTPRCRRCTAPIWRRRSRAAA